MRVLIADDFHAMRSTVKQALATLGYKDIVEASNGKEAWDRILANHDLPDRKIELCIADWKMPVIAGLNLLKMVRKDERVKGLLFILLLGEQTKENIVAALQADVDDCMVKPFNAVIFKKKMADVAQKKLNEIHEDVNKYLKELEEKGINPKLDGDARKMLFVFRKRFTKAGQIAPWSHFGSLYRGEMNFRFGENAEAEKRLREAIAKDFGSAKAHTLLSQVLRVRRKVPESIKELRIAVNTNPKSVELRQRFGEVLMRDGNHEEAAEVLAEAVRLIEEKKEKDKKVLARSKNSLGAAKMATGEKSGDEAMKNAAVSDMESAASLDPELVAAHYNLIVVYKKAGRAEDAMRVFDKVQAIEPKDAEGWVSLARAYLDRAEKHKAVFAFKKADDLADGRFVIYEEMSKELYDHKLLDEALVYLEKARESNPSDIFSYNLKGIIYRTQGKFADAMEQYTYAAKLEPDDAGVYFNLGVATLKCEKKDEAMGYFRKAKELDPELKEVDEYLTGKKK